MARDRIPIKIRFWEKVKKQAEHNGCWLWVGAKGNYGYGVIGKGGRGEGLARAHVLSWEWANNKKVPEGMCVCHSCDNPSCVNPKHLFIATQQENLVDMRLKQRGSAPPLHYGEKQHCAKLSPNKVKEIRKLHVSGLFKHRDLAKIFDVSKNTITSLLSGKTWRHIENDI